MPLTCEVVTPEATAMSRTTDIVVVPLFDGELAILPRHAAMIGRLGAGELRLGQGSSMERYFIEGGFVQVRNDRVVITTQTLTPVAALDASAIRKELDALKQTAVLEPSRRADLDRQIARSRTRLRMVDATGSAGH